MYILLAPGCTIISVQLTQHSLIVQVKFNLQPNNSSYFCQASTWLLSNSTKFSTTRQDISDTVENNLILHSQSGSSTKSCECYVVAAVKQAAVQPTRQLFRTAELLT